MQLFTKRVRAVYDTNIWVSALRQQGNPFRCALLAAMGFVVTVTCDELLDELSRVLTQKFGMPFCRCEPIHHRYPKFLRSRCDYGAVEGCGGRSRR